MLIKPLLYFKMVVSSDFDIQLGPLDIYDDYLLL